MGCNIYTNRSWLLVGLLYIEVSHCLVLILLVVALWTIKLSKDRSKHNKVYHYLISNIGPFELSNVLLTEALI